MKFGKQPSPDKEYLDEKRKGQCEASCLGDCQGDVVAAHNSKQTNSAGTGKKAMDCYSDSLCHFHHDTEHRRGVAYLWHKVLAESTFLLFEWRKKKQERDYLVSLWRRGERLKATEFLEWISR